jgi:16S rRNA (guanine527-N7)-methyltransferase
MEQFAALLRKWNAAIRLTGSVEAAAIDRHVREALSLVEVFEPDARVVDVGSGGGFPSIPLAIARPDLTLTLVEPIAKKVAFLRECRRRLELASVRVLRSRDDELFARADFVHFDAAVSQATFAPAEWLVRGSALVRPGGLVVAMLGEDRDGLTVLPFEIEIRETSLDNAPSGALALRRLPT